ncbi:MAG: site-specific integrase [Flavobacteriales bacterium]|nr:site-specific integrase [Flavobacteriales bacterium]
MTKAPKTWKDLRAWMWTHHYQFAKAQDSTRSIYERVPIPDTELIADIDRGYLRTVVTRMRTQDLSESTIRRYMTVVMKSLREAHKEGFIDSMPAMPQLPKPKQGRLRYLQEGEEEHLLACLDSVDHMDLVKVLVDTGLRLGEALALNDKDVDWLNETVTVKEAKNGQRRAIPMTSRVRSILVRRRPFVSIFTEVKSWQFHRAWNAAKKAMNLEHDEEFVPHCLRHTFASRLVQRGAGLQIVKELLGHKRIENTLIYAHLAPEQARAAINMLEET